MKDYLTLEVKNVIMVIVGLGALVFGFNYLKGKNLFVPSNSFYIKYEKLEGLEKSAPVTIKGYKIGQVNDIIYDFTQKEPFIVVVSLNEDVKIPVGSIFELTDDGLIGPKKIQIILDYLSNKFYEAGDTIPSIIAGNLFDAVEQDILPDIQKLIPQIDSLMRAVRALAEKPALQNTLESLEVSARNVEHVTGKFNTLMQNEIPVIVKDFNKVSSNFSEISESLNKADIGGTLATIDTTMQNLQTITDKINSDEGSIGLLLNDKTLYNNLTNTTDNANKLVIDIKEHPSRYIHFSVFGKSEKKK